MIILDNDMIKLQIRKEKKKKERKAENSWFGQQVLKFSPWVPIDTYLGVKSADQH